MRNFNLITDHICAHNNTIKFAELQSPLQKYICDPSHRLSDSVTAPINVIQCYSLF